MPNKMNSLLGIRRLLSNQRRRRCSGIFIVLFVSNFLVHLSECHGNSDTEIVLKPHVNSDSDLYYRTEYYQPKNSSQSGASAAPVVPWEDALKYTAYLTLNDSPDHSQQHQPTGARLEEALREAAMEGFDARPVPQFGDIVMLAMGTLQRHPHDEAFTFVRRKNICNEDDQIDINCLRKMPTNTTALWSVQKIRHRNEKGNYRFELRFGIIPMDGEKRHRMGREGQELPLRQYVAKQEDYPRFFNGQLSDSDLKKRSDFFEDAQPSVSQEVIGAAGGDVSSSSSSSALRRHHHHQGNSIDRTIFDLLPFFSDGDTEEKVAPQRHPFGGGYYGGAPSPYRPQHTHSFGRPMTSASEFYNFYSPPPAAPVRAARPRPAYPGAYSPSPLAALLNPLTASSYVRPVAYKPPHPQPHHPDYVRFPDSTYSFSSPFKSYAATPAQYHYMNHHPALPSPYQPSAYQPASPLAFNPISYFMNRNRAPTVNPALSAAKPQAYFQRPPFIDFRTAAESYQVPKKALYYTNLQAGGGGGPGGYEVSITPQFRAPGSAYKDLMNGAFSIQSQKIAPFQPLSGVPHQVSVVGSPQQYIPFSPHFAPSPHHQSTYPGHQSSANNPFVFSHVQMLPIPASQAHSQPDHHPQSLTSHHFQPHLFSQVSIPLSTSTFRFPNTIPLHSPDAQPTPNAAQSTAQIPTTTKTSSSSSADPFVPSSREPKHLPKFSEPDPLYANDIGTTTTSASRLQQQATPKISYFFPKDDEGAFKPLFPVVVPASTVRRNFTESEFKHALQQHHHQASYAKLNSFLANSGKGGIIYATPSSLPIAVAAAVYAKKAPPSNIIYGKPIETKVPPPTSRPKEVTKSQVPAPSKSTHRPPPLPLPSSMAPAPSRTTARAASTTPTKRVTPASTPINLITPPAITTAPRSATTTATTTTTITPGPSSPPSSAPSLSYPSPSSATTTTTTAATTTHRAKTSRGRQYSRSKVTTTTTEKPVLKWMPKRKRPKQEPSRVYSAAAATALPQPHISNRTRISAQASAPRPVIIPLDDVSMGPEEVHFQRRHEKYFAPSPTGGPSFVEKANGIITTVVPRGNNRKRKNHVHHEYTNFVTVPTTTPRPAYPGGDELIPEPQRNVFTTTTTTSYPTVPSTTTAVMGTIPPTTPVTESAALVQTLERDVYTTSAPHFLPTIAAVISTTTAAKVVPDVPVELFELSKAQVKPIETDTPDVALFKASLGPHNDDDNDDEQLRRLAGGAAGESNRHDSVEEDSEDDGDEEEGEEEDGLDFIAKSIVAHAKNIFSDASSNLLSSSEAERKEDEAKAAESEED